MRKDAAFEAEFLIAPKLGLVIVVEMSCTIALSAELLVYPWPPDFPTRPPWVSNLSNGAEEITFNAPIDGIYQVEVFGYSAAAYKLLVELDSVTAASGDLANQLTLPGGLDPNKPRPEAPVVPLQSKQQIGPDLQQTFYLPYVAR